MSALDPTPAECLEIALDLAELAEEMMLQNLRRAHPGETEAELLERLDRWMWTRPGAEYGDCEGRLVPWPRPDR